MIRRTLEHALVAVVSLAGCSSDSGTNNGGGGGAAPVATVAVTPGTVNLIVGDTLRLTATTRDSNGAVLTGRTVTWASSNTSFATELLTTPRSVSAASSASASGPMGTRAMSSSPRSLSLRRTSPCSHTDAALAVAPAFTIASKYSAAWLSLTMTSASYSVRP